MQSDEELIQRCRHNDPAAWETLVERYQRLVYSIPRRAGLSDDLAAEVFQHVFATLIARLDDIDRPAQIRAWLITTARRESWRVSRQSRAFESLDAATGDEAENLAGDDLLPEEEALRLEEQYLVKRAVDTLDERCRELLTLLFYQPYPLPYAEIAERLGTSAGSIGPSRARCLEKLRRRLNDTGF